MSTCFFISLPNGECSKFFIVAAVTNKSFSGKPSSQVINSYIGIFPDDKAEILAVCLSRFYGALFAQFFLSIVLIFSLTVIL